MRRSEGRLQGVRSVSIQTSNSAAASDDDDDPCMCPMSQADSSPGPKLDTRYTGASRMGSRWREFLF